MKYELKIGWLYPELMSTYGDRGNILALKKRCVWRGIAVTVFPINKNTDYRKISEIDLLFGGGSQDREQEIVMHDLGKNKKSAIKDLINNDKPALFVCGAPQLMGRFYEPSVGRRIEGIGIFDIETINPGPDTPRCTGNIVAEVNWANLINEKNTIIKKTKTIIVGFENHGGRTYLGADAKPFAKVLKGFGNNGTDKTEGIVYKNAIGCYFHGPLLPKNPQITDFLISKALQIKYKKIIELTDLDDKMEEKARRVILNRLSLMS